ncbi:hypothetical protein DPMN_110416 [Dreissena polymorpha]|uniref:Uncharacterized protein n=1 Tax=Dreissena polymorpha TaxID=45954 RepID=A0A9D4KC21_DREPO|nr:hypothetical protein DPMN_110416 [Dreissena polymorpha]
MINLVITHSGQDTSEVDGFCNSLFWSLYTWDATLSVLEMLKGFWPKLRSSLTVMDMPVELGTMYKRNRQVIQVTVSSFTMTSPFSNNAST